MRLLALQPYDAASHRAFLDGWQRHSRHDFTTLALPGKHFKWRMRQAPIGLAQRIESHANKDQTWDALWCTSMLDLAALRGLCPTANALPTAVYFHENQLTYPSRHPDARDVHFGLTNMTTALAAVASAARDSSPPCVWWNSAYNRDSFLTALDALLSTMPDHRPTEAVESIRRASAVHYPGIDTIKPTPQARSRPPLLLWAARWEYDKGPERFFDAIDLLAARGVDFRLSVIGQQFAEQPKCFEPARQRHLKRIVRWGYQTTRRDYEDALREADIVVSTSKHEFFGLAVAEAVSAGCKPVLPDALAYPEVWTDHARYHDQTPASIADAIEQAMADTSTTDFAQAADRFAWPTLAPQLDDAIEALVRHRV